MFRNQLLAIFLGSGLGGILRHSLSTFAARSLGNGFPYGTLIVNLIAAFLLGAIIELWALHTQPTPLLRSLVVTGIIGGFSTFSAFTLETVTLFERQQTMLAVSYVVASIAGAMLALSAGMWLTRQFS